MKRFFVFLLSAGATVSLWAQAPAKVSGDIKITFADGHVQAASAVRGSKDTVLATIEIAKGVRGETGYPISSIKQIEFPEPPQLRAARRALAAGKPADALSQVNTLVAQQNDLRAIPGNIWATAALTKVDALLALGREKEADELIKRLSADAKDPDAVLAARLAQAFVLLHGGKSAQAAEAFDKVIAESKVPASLARAWYGKGEALRADKDYDGALLAYLRLPIFYANESAFQSAALLGCVESYEGLRDFDHANEAIAELTKTYPNSPEAAATKAISERIKKKIDADGTPAANP